MSFLSHMTVEDVKSIIAGMVAWLVAIPPVMIAGNAVSAVVDPTATTTKGSDGRLVLNRAAAVVVGVGIAKVTTPALSYIMGWTTPSQKVRGIALALGAAQTLDGIVHLFYPTFYANDPTVGLACAGNIFLGAGLLGIFSAYA
jgi:hypothetical protein